MPFFSRSNIALTLECLENGCRFDGRGRMDFRELSFRFAKDVGQVEVSLGATRAMCVVSGKVVIPSKDRPNEGLLLFKVNFGSLASSSPEQTGSSGGRLFEEEANEICSIIERLLKGSRAVDTEALCISAGLEAWSLKVEVWALEADGNLRDACALAAIAGLLHFRRKDRHDHRDSCGAQLAGVGNEVPLSIHHIPILLSFGFCGDEKSCLLDPSAAEEEVLTGTLSLAVNQFRDLCGIHKLGGEPLCMKSFALILKVAEKQAGIIIGKLKKALEADFSERRSKKRRLHYRYSSEAFNVHLFPTMPLCEQDNAPSLLASPLPWSPPPGLPAPRPAEAQLLSSGCPAPQNAAQHSSRRKNERDAEYQHFEKKTDRVECPLPFNGQSVSTSFKPSAKAPVANIPALKPPSSPLRDCYDLMASDSEDSDLAKAVKKQKKGAKKRR